MNPVIKHIQDTIKLPDGFTLNYWEGPTYSEFEIYYSVHVSVFSIIEFTEENSEYDSDFVSYDYAIEDRNGDKYSQQHNMADPNLIQDLEQRAKHAIQTQQEVNESNH